MGLHPAPVQAARREILKGNFTGVIRAFCGREGELHDEEQHDAGHYTADLDESDEREGQPSIIRRRTRPGRRGRSDAGLLDLFG